MKKFFKQFIDDIKICDILVFVRRSSHMMMVVEMNWKHFEQITNPCVKFGCGRFVMTSPALALYAKRN